MLKRFFCFVAAMLILSCPVHGYNEDWIVVEDEDTKVTYRDQARFLMRNMTLKEKIYQLFFSQYI